MPTDLILGCGTAGGPVDLVDDLHRLQPLEADGANRALLAQHSHDIAIDILMVRHRALVEAVVVGDPALAELRRLHAIDVLVLDLVEVLPADLNRALLAK